MISEEQISDWLDKLHGGLFEVQNPYVVTTYNDEYALIRRRIKGAYDKSVGKVVGRVIENYVVKTLLVDESLPAPIIVEQFSGTLNCESSRNTLLKYGLSVSVYDIAYDTIKT